MDPVFEPSNAVAMTRVTMLVLKGVRKPRAELAVRMTDGCNLLYSHFGK